MDEPPSTPTIVDIRSGTKGRLRALRLDDGRVLLFSDEACERCRLEPGMQLTDETLEALEAAEQRVNAHEAALKLLAKGSRSETEMRTRLRLRGIEAAAIEDEIARLRGSALLDDEQFARAWVEDRRRSAPRGRRMLRYELLGRGIDPAAVDAATSAIDDREIAIALARSKARGSALASYEAFVTKVGGFLRRRGFDYEVAGEATRTAWLEATGALAPLEGEAEAPA
jgi:regulatory protein